MQEDPQNNLPSWSRSCEIVKMKCTKVLLPVIERRAEASQMWLSQFPRYIPPRHYRSWFFFFRHIFLDIATAAFYFTSLRLSSIRSESFSGGSTLFSSPVCLLTLAVAYQGVDVPLLTAAFVSAHGFLNEVTIDGQAYTGNIPLAAYNPSIIRQVVTAFRCQQPCSHFWSKLDYSCPRG
jgi:hypothetical protein